MDGHPIWGPKHVRAIFAPRDQTGLNKGTQQMVGHEFVWRFVAMFDDETAVWQPADPEDIDAYFEVVDTEKPDWRHLWVMEPDLDIIGIERSELDA